jgi:hypothetical protein
MVARPEAFLLAAALLPAVLVALAEATTVLDCDRAGSAYEAFQLGIPPGPACRPGGPTGSFLRLVDSTAVAVNAIAFDLTDPGAHDQIIADFDFRMTPRATDSRADGFGFTLASTARFGTSGPVAGHSEEADVAGSLGIGFDIHQGPGEVSRNHVSVHLNASKLAEIDATPLLDLASGHFTHARIIARPGAAPPDLTIILTPCGSAPVTLVDRMPVPGLVPYEARVHVMARSGGEAALHDLDNLNVQFLTLDEGTVSFGAATYESTELEGGAALVTVRRAGGIQHACSVPYSSADLSATAGEDYTPVSGTLTFASGEDTQTIRVPILDDGVSEGEERLTLRLEAPTAGAVLGGPSETQITIVDDETARATGHWSGAICWPIVAIHALSLPDGRVMLWPGDEGPHGGRNGDDPRAWDPATGVLEPLTRAGYDIFCSGHTLTADGKVFVAGGNAMEAVGLSRASLYDPTNDSWTDLPDMNAGRWYPTTTALSNSDLLVTEGSIDESKANEIPQVLPAGGGAWRDLTGARRADAGVAMYYPWMYVAPNGQVFCAGREQTTWYLDTRGAGSWTPVAPSNFGLRDNGSSVMYEPGKVLIVGGNTRPFVPSATAEVIDLSAPNPAWRYVASMALPRRHLNATLLPDGTVLATGGTSSPGFNDATAPALAAEVWDPATEAWTTLASMQVPRLYHSTALLLHDGRVLCAGGGLPPATAGDFNHLDAEIFSPPYLFKGPRPVIAAAPATVSYGEAFLIETPEAAGIAAVHWIRLSSVTHSFNENQRMNRLTFTVTRAGLFAIAPRDSDLCPPGHYLLFILNADGVPSLGRVVRVSRPPPGKAVPGSQGLAMRARSNPGLFGLLIEFTLPDGEPAELSVFDVSGRRILSREVGRLGAGVHVCDVGPGLGMAPGVYLIRLTRGPRSVSAKAVLLRP